MRNILTALAALMMLSPMPAPAQAVDEREAPTIDIYAWAERDTTGNQDAETVLGGGVSASMPIYIGGKAGLKTTTDVHVTQAPGTVFDPTSLDTFGRSAEFNIGLEYNLTHTKIGDKSVSVSARCQAGFLTALGEEPQSERYWRTGSCGPLFETSSANGKASLYIGYGRDERGGPEFGLGQIALNGYVPVLGLGEDFAVMVGADAVLNVRNPNGGCLEVSPGRWDCLPGAAPKIRDALKFYVGMAWGK